MDDEAVGELELIVPWRVVFERLALQHQNNRMVKGLSIPIYVRTNRRVGCLSMSMFQNNRFRFSLLIFYRPDSSTVLEMSIDSYVFQRNASRLGVLSRLDEP